MLVLDAHNTTAPSPGELSVIIVLSLEGLSELLKVDEVLAADAGESNSRSGLHVNELAKVGLATDEAEGDTLLSAKSRQVDDNLKRVNVVSDDDKLGLTFLDEGGHVVKTELEVHGLLSLGSVLLGSSLQTLSLLLLGLRSVLGEQFKELSGYSS